MVYLWYVSHGRGVHAVRLHLEWRFTMNKPWFWFGFFLGFTMAYFAMMLSGCTTAEMTFPDGRHFSYYSGILGKKINSLILYPDGSFYLEGYQSDASAAIKLAETAIARIPVKP